MPRSPKTKTVAEKTPTEPAVVPAPPPISPYKHNPLGGHPTYLTDERRAIVLAAIRKGMPVEKAVNLIGVRKTTWYNWIRRGKDENEQDFWREFGAQVEQAQAEGMMAMLDKIDAAAAQPQHWTAAAWRLERTNPESFAKTQTVTVNLSRLTQEQFDDALAEAGLRNILDRPDEEGALTGGGEAWLSA